MSGMGLKSSAKAVRNLAWWMGCWHKGVSIIYHHVIHDPQVQNHMCLLGHMLLEGWEFRSNLACWFLFSFS